MIRELDIKKIVIGGVALLLAFIMGATAIKGCKPNEEEYIIGKKIKISRETREVLKKMEETKALHEAMRDFEEDIIKNAYKSNDELEELLKQYHGKAKAETETYIIRGNGIEKKVNNAYEIIIPGTGQRNNIPYKGKGGEGQGQGQR